MFIDALGGLFSVIGVNANIMVKVVKSNPIFSDINVTKTYGNMWKIDEQKLEYNVTILQLFSGVSKEFMFEITVPPIKAIV